MMNQKLSFSQIFGRKADVTRILLSVVFIALVFIPLVRMFINIDSDSLHKVTASPTFSTVIANSLTATAIATILTLIIAYLLAVSIERTNIRFKSVFGIIFCFANVDTVHFKWHGTDHPLRKQWDYNETVWLKRQYLWLTRYRSRIYPVRVSGRISYV